MRKVAHAQEQCTSWQKARRVACLLAEALGEGSEGMLGGRVERAAASAIRHAVAAHRADVDDVPILAPPRHVLQHTSS